MNQCAPHWWVWHGGYHDSWAARENCKTGTEGSRKCGDHIRVRHPVPFHLFLRKSSLISRHHHTCATTCEVLRNLPDTTWPLLPLWHSPLLFASLFLPSRETFPKCDLWSYPCHLPLSPFPLSGNPSMLRGSNVSSRHVIPLSPLDSTHSLSLLQHLTSGFPLPNRCFHSDVLLSSQTKHAWNQACPPLPVSIFFSAHGTSILSSIHAQNMSHLTTPPHPCLPKGKSCQLPLWLLLLCPLHCLLIRVSAPMFWIF